MKDVKPASEDTVPPVDSSTTFNFRLLNRVHVEELAVDFVNESTGKEPLDKLPVIQAVGSTGFPLIASANSLLILRVQIPFFYFAASLKGVRTLRFSCCHSKCELVLIPTLL